MIDDLNNDIKQLSTRIRRIEHVTTIGLVAIGVLFVTERYPDFLRS